MSVRPATITVFALYLLIVFGISTVGSLYGAIKTLPPYSASEWLVLTIPKVTAILAGLAFWKMLRVGVWLWATSVLSEWVLAFGMGTGFLPSFNVAFTVTMFILAASIWVIYTNWNELMSLSATRKIEGAMNA